MNPKPKTIPRLLALLCTLTATPTLLANPPQPPNVILIMTDDQGYGDFGAHGNPVLETPHLDAMAGRSASMSTFYVCPVCAPTRAGLMTGRYNYRTRAIDTYLGRAMMEPAEVTIAELLADAGYATGIFGKWHLGDCYPMRPIDQGFQESLIHLGGGLAQPSEPLENARRYTDPILFHNGQQVHADGYCTDVYFDAAFDFIEDARRNDRPFFAYIPTNAPHGPYHDVPEQLREHYLQKDLAGIMVPPPGPKRKAKQLDALSRIAAMITNVDQNVGRLFEKLDSLEITKNTLVIFLVDNGPNSRRFVGPFRGSKGGVHEGGIRSPLWLHWPSQLQAGTTRAELTAHIDLMPTILDACQVKLPRQLDLDGMSFLPLLTDPSATWPDRQIATQWHRGDVPVRYHHFMIRNERWKLLNNSNPSVEKLAEPPQFELYDLTNDPGESTNLIEQRPKILARLKRAYDRWFDDVSATRPDNYAPPRIILGTPHETTTTLTRQDWRGSNGWHEGTNGHWLVRVATPGEYDLRVILEPDSPGGRLRLQVGDVTLEKKLPLDASHYTFANVELPAGDIKIASDQITGENTRGAYQIVVSRH